MDPESERVPLLTIPPSDEADVYHSEEAEGERKLGPLEISRSNRWTILAGVWMANFVGVGRTAC